MPRFIVLEIQVADNATAEAVDWIREGMGECARDFEAHEAEQKEPFLSLLPDPDDEGRFTWSSYDKVVSYR